MRILDLALKDLTQLVRDWKAALFLIVMPILFTLLFGLIFSGAGGDDDMRLPVGFLDQDYDNVLSGHLLTLLEASDAVRPVVLTGNAASAEEQVSDGELAAAVIVPATYSKRILTDQEARLTVIVDTSSPDGTTARQGVQTVVTRLRGAVKAARLGVWASTQSDQVELAFLEAALEEAVAAWKQPPLTVEATQSGAIAAGENDAEAVYGANTYAHSSAGMMVQFAMAGMIGAGEILLLERKSKALQRLLTTAISRAGIILGHFLAMFVMIFVQLALLIGFGQLALGVDYLRAPLALLLMVAPLALWVASMGLLIGVLARTEDQVVIFAMIPMLLLSGLGGAWMPLEFTSETFQTIGHLTPVAWAMDGLKNIVVRGLGLESVLLPASVLLAYAIVFFVLAVWRFKFE
ncbi:MAG: ABC transporter permease [Chloroflexota bacterium]|nr:ABC transporter permease [Chloroflexota bacterium]